MGKPDQILLTIGNIRKNVYGPGKKWECMVSDCSASAIVSHLLQRNGILDSVAEDGHMILVQVSDSFHWEKGVIPVDFKRVGIRGAISIPLLCDKHDTELFSEIETPKEGSTDIPLNPYDYRHQILLSLRTMYAEKRRKQQAAEFSKRMSVAHTLPYAIRITSKDQLQSQLVAIRDLDVYISDLESEIVASKDLFDFKVYEYEEVKVCSTAGLSLCDDVDKNADMNYILPTAFFHAFPLNGIFYIVVGCHKEHRTVQVNSFMDSWAGLSKIGLQKELTKLFVQRIETWGMAPSLFKTIRNDKIEQFKKHQMDAMISMPMPNIDFNLFD